MSGVLVVMEQRGGVWNRMSFEALAAGQQLAAKLGVECSAAVLGQRCRRWRWSGDEEAGEGVLRWSMRC